MKITKPVLNLDEHIEAARDLREVSRLLTALIMKFGRQGILVKGPNGDLYRCMELIFNARCKADIIYRNQFPGAPPDIYI